jgi:Domain of unknown function (DUF4916)
MKESWLSSDGWKLIQMSIPVVCRDVSPVRFSPNPRRELRVVGLILRETPDGRKWWLIGGRLMHRETLSDATHRQVAEALGRHISYSLEQIDSCCRLLSIHLQEEGETFRLTPHEVGRALTSLGFTNRKRTNAGFTLWLDLRTQKRIHKLAHDHGIEQDAVFRGETFGNDCDLCKNTPASDPGSAEKKEDSGITSK